MIRTVNPATDEVLAEYQPLGREALKQIVDRSYSAFESWRHTPVSERAKALGAVAHLATERREQLAETASLEMGKPVSTALSEVDNLFHTIFTYYARNADELLADRKLYPASGDDVIVKTLPLGPLLGIMPWNYPYYQVARFAAPNLLLGNTIIIKHAANTTGSAVLLEQLMHDAGIPADAYINVVAGHRDLDAVIGDPRVAGVSLTGSESAGSAVAELAGRHLKKVVLELGGSDPFVVLDDHNLDAVVATAAAARITNAGQACVSPKRMIVLESVYEEFANRLSKKVATMTPGDPAAPATVLGPLASIQARNDTMEVVQDAVERGATVLAGGRIIDGPGAFMEATVLADVTPEMRAWKEEIFGPVAVLYRARDIEEAVTIANDSDYGLGASVWAKDTELAADVASRLEVGMVGINGLASTQPEIPFGGVKRSGIGRELGPYGVDEFSNKKMIRVPATVRG